MQQIFEHLLYSRHFLRNTAINKTDPKKKVLAPLKGLYVSMETEIQ